MKKLFYLFCCMFAVLFAACEGTEPPTSNKVVTGASENITQTSATLKGVVNVDIADYNSIEFGVMYDTLLAEVNNRSAQMVKGSVLMGKDFSINLDDLTENTKYYYCAYLLLNGMQYEFGAVKQFTTLSSSDKPNDPSIPGSFVAKPFSVSATQMVTFSPGNLQYHPANDEWRFAPSQLDYVGADNAKISPSYNGWIDLFGRGTGNNPTNNSTDYEDYPTFVDWGVNKIGNDAPNTWRTLTDDEWEYIINERSNASNLIGVAQVNGVNGLILLPDNWICPSGVTFKSGFNAETYYSPYAIEEYQTFNASDWAKLEASGAVFLPAAGGRFDDNINELHEAGGYWSIGESIAIGLFPGFGFSSRGADIYPWNCETGHSVRLVTTLASIDEPAYTAVFIRGQFNEWGESYELTTTDGDYYVLETTFDLQGEFKIASSDWSTINYGGTHTISAGTEQVLIEGSNDNLTADGNIAVAKVEFTVSTGILLITAAQTPSTPDTPDVPSSATGVANGHEYVDLGLSVKWATCNVGANSPEKYGNYFNWLEGSSTNSSDFIVVVPLNRDGANINWGGSWRIPSINEWDELISRCTWLWTTQKGIKGYKVISNINKKSIFIPAAGYRKQSGVKEVGSWGEYWANSLFLINDSGFPAVHTICFSDIGYECSNANPALIDLPIRAVHP